VGVALRMSLVRVLVLSMLLTLLGRLAYLELAGAPAAGSQVRSMVTPAPRGEIVDTAGHPLVANRTVAVVTVDRATLAAQRDGGAEVLRRLAGLLGTSAADLRRRVTPCAVGVARPCWSGSPLQPAPVRTDAAPHVTFTISEHAEDYRGVAVTFAAVRSYPGHTLAAQLLGYLAQISPKQLASARYADYRDSDIVGAAGLEAQYDAALRGSDGVRRVAIDHSGSPVGVVSQTPPMPGGTLVTNLDARLQSLAERSLADGLAAARQARDRLGRPYRATAGAVVVLDPRTGAVLAMASNPTYDLGVWAGGISTGDYARLTSPAAGSPLTSRATQGEYAPGSTFKLVSASAAVRAGYPLSGSYPCPGSFAVGSARFANYDHLAYGPMTLRRALIKSCDTVFYRFGYRQWLHDGGLAPRPGQAREVFARTAQAYGFGVPTGVDLPAEAAGAVPDRAAKAALWREFRGDYCAGAVNPRFDAVRRQADAELCTGGYRYRAGDAVNFAIGQGDVLVTPLQLAVAYAALANGGSVWRPQVAREVRSRSGAVTWRATPQVVRHLPLDAATLSYLRSALAAVTQPGGTAAGAFAGWPQDRIPVAGKTGTAEVGLTKNARQDTSWFAGFAPADHPRYVVVSMLEQVGTGAANAAWVVRHVLDGIYRR